MGHCEMGGGRSGHCGFGRGSSHRERPMTEQPKMRKKPPLQGGGGECRWHGRSKQSAGRQRHSEIQGGRRSPCVLALGAWFSALIQGQKKQPHLAMVTEEERMPQPRARRPFRICAVEALVAGASSTDSDQKMS
ncbi:hypothetical protein GW17_00022995 [Ensete ventricosum]|nr:hypothetical protein GW17_00022995 [Ensete ventricosum]